MSLAIGSRVKALGTVGFAVPGTPAWIGDHPGFDAVITDNGPGDFTVSLDSAESGGDLTILASSGITAGGFPAFVTVDPLAGTRSVRIRVFDDAGIALDNQRATLLAVQIPPQA